MRRAILPDTAVEIMGRMGKIRTTPISRITPDIGSTMIWGEIFSAEQKVTRDGSRKIYSINITDYTGSITLKILQNINECKALDSLSKGTSVIVRGDISSVFKTFFKRDSSVSFHSFLSSLSIDENIIGKTILFKSCEDLLRHSLELPCSHHRIPPSGAPSHLCPLQLHPALLPSC